MRDDQVVHEAIIRAARRRLWLVATAGLLVLGLTMAAIVFPVAWIMGALSNPAGSGLGYGWGLIAWALTISGVIGLLVALVVFAWSWFAAERRILEFVRAWPHPRSSTQPPPRLPPDALATGERILDALVLAAGVHKPHLAVVIDDAPNCLTVGRKPETAWIVVTTGLVESLSYRELEAVLAYELGRVVELEVSLDTVVYALTGSTLQVWAAAFDDLDEVSIILFPLGLIAAPFVIATALLRSSVLHSRAKFSDGLAVRYCRNPVALVHALRKVLENPHEVRRGDPANAHLWLEYPHTRASRWLLRTHRILPRRVRRLERLAGLPGKQAASDP